MTRRPLPARLGARRQVASEVLARNDGGQWVTSMQQSFCFEPRHFLVLCRPEVGANAAISALAECHCNPEQVWCVMRASVRAEDTQATRRAEKEAAATAPKLKQAMAVS